MTFAFKILKQMLLHNASCFFLIAFVYVPSKSEFISGFPHVVLTTTLTCEKVNQTVAIAVNFMVYLETFAVVVLVNVSVSSIFKQTLHLDLPHFSEPTFFLRGRVSLSQGNFLSS